MQWAADNLREETFYTSADDDFIINMARLAESVDENFLKKEKSNWKNFPIICGFVKGINERVVRSDEVRFAKWAVSKEDYQSAVYPTYCHGGVYSTSVLVAKQLYRASRSEKLLHLDDVFITGILRKKIGMPEDLVVSSGRSTGFHFGDDVEQQILEKLGLWLDQIINFFRSDQVCSCRMYNDTMV